MFLIRYLSYAVIDIHTSGSYSRSLFPSIFMTVHLTDKNYY